MAYAVLSIGSNLGEREVYVASMERELYALLDEPLSSPLMETAPVGVEDLQPPYLNKIIAGRYTGVPRQLLDECRAIELRLGRTREIPKGARTADVDILLFDRLEINEDTLIIPHPQILCRRFCLEGLMRIDPQIVVSGCGGGRTVEELYKNMPMDIAAQDVFFVELEIP